MDLKEDILLQFFGDFVLLNEILTGSQTKQCLQKIGIKYGMQIEDQFRSEQENQKELSVEQYAQLVTDFFSSLGGEYKVSSCDREKVIFTCRKCPFGHMVLKTPALCEVSAGVLGGMAARNFSYSKVSPQRSVAHKSCDCTITVYIKETQDAAEAEGTFFPNEPRAYMLTRNEIQAMSEDAVSTSNVYRNYVQSLENLQTIHREMETEYNQLRDEIFSDLKLGVLTVNVSGKITYMNKTAQNLLHAENHWDTAVTQEFQRLLSETLQENNRHNQYILNIPFPEGTRYYSVNTAPLLGENEEVSGAVSVFQDVTEQKILEAEMLQMEKFSLVAELAAGTAHEIRNPMTTMRGFLQILAKEFKSGTKGYEYCELMIEEIDRANAIIKEFLLLTKPAAPNLRECDLHVILEEIFMLIESKSLLEDVKLNKRYAKSLPLVEADPAQIKQVFLNLATNAIQAMPAGGELTIATSVSNGTVVVRFTDTGCGIEEAQLARLFDPFFTTKEQGTGLGLTISYRIIEGHRGRLHADSAPGKGTTFYVELPGLKK
ncbi:two-component system sensor histidine kinase NtrB [Dethiobacter alkaliphilus]|uniref:two-component system sensor histidine kinase NtrB n=1 Tax=Dethiobacter alkaliphilus TaxID=427926 RepID=UPI00222621D9|nr:ATP-binding protein [Dethiobacter alkaliphilus]MCW3489115.1 ATP-binding protein [Dethiobacter alkaliphilus]